jgi:hypothetical protein
MNMDEEIANLESMIKEAMVMNEKNIILSNSDINDYKIIDESLHLHTNSNDFYQSIFLKEQETLKLQEYEQFLEFVKLTDNLCNQLNDLNNFDSILKFLRKNEEFFQDLSIKLLKKDI